MELICTRLRLSDTWFQVGFVAAFLCLLNTVFFFWSDARFWENLLIVLAIDTFFLIAVFSNLRVWKTFENHVRITHTVLGIPWRSRFIPQESLLHIAIKRVSDDEVWSNCLADLHWTETDSQGMIVTKSATILQRRQALDVSVTEAKQVAKSLGIKFVDNTNRKSIPKPRRNSMNHDTGPW